MMKDHISKRLAKKISKNIFKKIENFREIFSFSDFENLKFFQKSEKIEKIKKFRKFSKIFKNQNLGNENISENFQNNLKILFVIFVPEVAKHVSSSV